MRTFFEKKPKLFSNFQKNVFLLRFLAQKLQPVVNFAREARFWHQKSLF